MYMSIKKQSLSLTFIFSMFLLMSINLFSQEKDVKLRDNNKTAWVDSVFNTLSLDEKIGQLFIVRANYPDKGFFKSVDTLIKNNLIGGVTFFKSSPIIQANKTNYWQSLAKTPLFISIDAEWGLGMRLDSTISFPLQMTLGAIQGDDIIFEMGSEIAKHCKRMGIQMNFAPVVDINCNPQNPVINSRSFGEDKFNVFSKGKAYMNGLQENGIIATAKHFPGHGDTESDSHKTLPIIYHDINRLDSIELFPFKELIKNGLEGIMIAHLYVPALENTKNTPTTLSYPVVTDLLRNKLGFKGLVVTDALDMRGVTKYFEPGEIELKALEAGNDILLLPQNVPTAIERIKKAIENNELDESVINKKCKKILAYKFKTDLSELTPIDTLNLISNLNNFDAKFLNRRLYEKAVTLVKNDDDILPLKKLDTLKIAAVSIGRGVYNEFQQSIERYAEIKHFSLPKISTEKERDDLIKELSNYNLIIIGVQNTNMSAYKNFGLTNEGIAFVNKVSLEKKTILNIFANPYSLSNFPPNKNIKAILVSYQDNYYTQDISGQIIFGGIGAQGKLPVTASPDFPLGTGINTKAIRLKYTEPEELNISRDALAIADSIALSGITMEAYPGCQIIAAKDGKVFYNKSFGYHTYDSNLIVKNTDIYDLASITKIAATTISVMKLSENNKIDIDEKISSYLPYLRNSDKKDIVIRELMSHQAMLQPWIPYYRSTIENGELDTTIYNKNISIEFPIRVAENLFIKKDYAYSIFDSIIFSSSRNISEYKYSDLGFYLLSETIKNISNKPFDKFVEDNFYKSLGINDMVFLPREHFELSGITPTEDDKEFRNQLIHGDVHDPGAAMLGGIAGHAGLFSNANDLAILMQMLLQNGEYAGKKYLNKETIKEFTRCQFPLTGNRRGIGFDKPLLEYDSNGPTCEDASPESFGHSGFTGTYVWADPKENFIYIFLSNRVYPDASNWKIVEYNIRTNLHQAFYDAIKNSKLMNKHQANEIQN